MMKPAGVHLDRPVRQRADHRLSFPILTVTCIALLSLQTVIVGTHFFTNDMGGNMP